MQEGLKMLFLIICTLQPVRCTKEIFYAPFKWFESHNIADMCKQTLPHGGCGHIKGAATIVVSVLINGRCYKDSTYSLTVMSSVTSPLIAYWVTSNILKYNVHLKSSQCNLHREGTMWSDRKGTWLRPSVPAEVCEVSSLPRKREGYHSSPVGRRQRHLLKCRKGEILMLYRWTKAVFKVLFMWVSILSCDSNQQPRCLTSL